MSIFILITAALFSFVAQAENKKVLLVSDIDDTIKVSHILNPIGAVARAGNVYMPFTGMSDLYKLIINQNPSSTRMIYLSNAPEKIAGISLMRFLHEKFLIQNDFPKGDLLLRESLSEKNHKIKTIRKLVAEEKPDIVIMVGDNGEQDNKIYEQAAKELKAMGIHSETYIHQLYSIKNKFIETGKPLLGGEIGYVTPFEIALDLKNKKWLDQASIDWMIENIMPPILEENSMESDTSGPITFPSFIKCSDFKWTVIVPPELLELSSKINKICR